MLRTLCTFTLLCYAPVPLSLYVTLALSQLYLSIAVDSVPYE